MQTVQSRTVDQFLNEMYVLQCSKEEIQIPLMESFGIEVIGRHCHSLLRNETEHFHYS